MRGLLLVRFALIAARMAAIVPALPAGLHVTSARTPGEFYDEFCRLLFFNPEAEKVAGS